MSSNLGRMEEIGHSQRLWELKGKRFPYQELRVSVLVWHATCIRRGQKRWELGMGTEDWDRGRGNRQSCQFLAPSF